MKKIIISNLKMNTVPSDMKSYSMQLATKTAGSKNRIIVCMPFTHFHTAKQFLDGSKIEIGAQNVSDEEAGKNTGEISASMLKDSGVSYIIVGHSERRSKFKETDRLINKKLKMALSQGLKVILCIGEDKVTREAKGACAFVKKQLDDALKGIYENELESVIIAYEPIWAIGTGKSCDAVEANRTIGEIRNVIKKLYGESVSDEIRILYGGSVKPSTIVEQMAQPEIDGGLIGGASLKADSFIELIKGAM